MSTRLLTTLFLVLATSLLVETLTDIILRNLIFTKNVILHLKKSQIYTVKIKDDLWEDAIDAFEDPKIDVSFNLAPSYGTLTLNSLEQIDESLRVMISGILRMNIHDQYSWKELTLALDMNFFVQKQTRYSVNKIEKIAFRGVRFVGQGGTERQKLNLIRSWFNNLIGNADILDDTDIDVDILAKMVNDLSGTMMSKLMERRSKKMTIMDLGILRFPDISKPFFSIYRISLIGSCNFHKFILHQEESSEILGLYQREVYYPDQRYINSLRQEVMGELLAEVDDLFSD